MHNERLKLTGTGILVTRDCKDLESRNSHARHLEPVGKLFELLAVVDGERHERTGLRPPGACPVQVIERFVLPQRPLAAAVREEMIELGKAGEFRRAQEA